MSQTVRNNLIRELPKLELHCHLDGSLTQKSIEEIMERPVVLSELQVEPDCRNLAEYLQKFDLPIQCLQTREGIKKASKEFLLDVAKENVRYMEVRLAPTCSINDHMTYRDVMEATLDGLEEARKECGTYYNVIVCCMRHFDLETNLAMLKGCREFLGAGVCAADLAGDERFIQQNEKVGFLMKQFTYTIQDSMGIHARPAGLLVKAAAAFKDTTIEISSNGKKADVKRIMAIMSMGVKQGAEVTVTCEGADEDAAAEAMEKFFKENL